MDIFILKESEVRSLADFCVNDTWDIYDSRFGPRRWGDICVRCKTSCHGHYGYLNLGIAIPHPMFTSELEKEVNQICHNCGLDIDDIRCPSCHHKNYKNYVVDHSGNLVRSTGSEPLTKVYDVINSEYVLRSVLIPPVRTRSPEDVEYMSDLSSKYENLIKATRSKHRSKIYLAYEKILGSKRSEGMSKLWSGKAGIFRNIMLGKRVDNSARSVVTGDPNLEYSQVGVPRKISNQIQIQVKAQPYNISYLKDLCKQSKIFIGSCPLVDESLIVPGYVYTRSLMDGDMVILNRQPSLTKSSLGAFRVKVKDSNQDKESLWDNTISINPLVTPNFNADFDGDEMNIFYVGSLHELDQILDVNKSCPPLPIQDTITGIFKLSQEEFVSQTLVMNFVTYLSNIPGLRDNIRRSSSNLDVWTGRQVLSLCLYKHMNYEDLNLVVHQGELIQGEITKHHLGNILRLGSVDEQVHMVQAMQKLSGLYLGQVGLTISLEDCISGEDTNSGLVEMIKSGAKGGQTNLDQISKQLGQQHLFGQVPSFGDGFIRSSYVQGLDPSEFFLHQMCAREGIINTGVSTASTGYLNRRACKLMGDIRVNYNQTIGSPGCTIRRV